MTMAALAIALVAAALAQAAHAQDGGEAPDALDGLSSHVERANRINTILYVVSFAVGAGLAGIAICATHSNTRELREQVRIHERHIGLLQRDIDDKATPFLAWTTAEREVEAKAVAGSGRKLIAFRVVNAGRAPAMEVTGDVTHMLSRDGNAFAGISRERHAWGALLPSREIEVHVWVGGEALEAVRGARGAFRADIQLGYQSANGTRHSLQMTVRYDGERATVRDARA